MKHRIHDTARGKLKVAGYISGSGNSLWKVHELQKELEQTWEGSPFEITGCFSSDPEAKGVSTAEGLGIPVESLDLRAFYRAKGEKFANMELRAEYDREVLKLIEKFNADVILLAGYVWATTSAILDNYTVINVHPADLSVMKDGKKAFAGANGVGDALTAGMKELRSSSHIATSQIDGGPVLVISPGVDVDYSLAETLSEKDFMRTYLRLVNEQSRLVAARTVYEIALGNFEIDDTDAVFYCGDKKDHGIKIDSWEENKPSFLRNIEAMIKPKSIAVIGASSRGGIGNAVVKSIKSVNYSGKVAVVNRNGDDVLDIPGYKKLDEVPHDVEMAVITVPSPFVLSVAEDCGRKGVKAVVCIAAGFKELGEEGAEAELKLKSIIDKYNMRMIGPNCMGISNNSPSAKLNTTILHDIPQKGNIGFVTQSGGLGAVLLDYSKHLGIGFSIVASLGNQADVTANDILPLLAEDDATKVILLYLETIPDYRRFKQIASRITPKKPIILIKSGRTEAGARAASSHTGSIAGNDSVTGSLIDSCGIIRAESVYSAFFTASALSKFSPLTGKRIAVVTNGGGPGILVSDALVKAGFEIPRISRGVQEKLKSFLMAEASAVNPIDLVAPAPPEHYAGAVKEVMKSGEFDAVALLCIPPATIHTEEVARGVVEGLKAHKDEDWTLPLLSCFFGPSLGEGGRKEMTSAGYACVEYPEQIAEIFSSCLKREVNAVREFSHKKPSGISDNLPAPDSQGYLPQQQAWELLEKYNFDIAAPVLVKSGSEIDKENISFPLVAKIDHPDIVHKSDAGGVILGIDSLDKAVETVEKLMAKFPGARGVILQRQIESDKEIILGTIKDEASGQAVMVGLGGIFVELMEDVSFLHVPFSREAALKAVRSLKSSPLLTGFRGQEGVNLESLLDNMMNINHLLMDFPGITEMDLNPVMYCREKNKFIIADCRIRL